MQTTVSPDGPLRGRLSVPGDKSVSHRALILAAMAKGTSELRGLAPGVDVASTRACLGRLGLAVPEGPSVSLKGNGWSVSGGASLDAGNSGTTMRLLTGALAARPGRYVLSGDASLSTRPMARVAIPLRLMGASVALADGGRPPVTVEGRSLNGISYELPIASAQVKTAILLAGLQAEGATVVTGAGDSRDHTERLLAWLGLPVTIGPGTVALGEEAHLPLPAFALQVPGDFSSAAFWVTAATLVPGSEVHIDGVGINPSRTGLLEVLRAMGAEIEVAISRAEPELTGSLVVRAAVLRAAAAGGAVVARTIDELPLVAVAATQAEGVTTIRDAAELRVKESDRLAVLASGLRAMGASVEELPDGLAVRGPCQLAGARVDAAGDHRMAMAFAVAGLVASDAVRIEGWESTAISYPGFLEDLARLAGSGR